MLLHAWIIVLFGTTTYGGSQRDRDFGNTLDVTLRALTGELGSGFRFAPGVNTDSPGSALLPRAGGAAPAPRGRDLARPHDKPAPHEAPPPARAAPAPVPPAAEPLPRLNLDAPEVVDKPYVPAPPPPPIEREVAAPSPTPPREVVPPAPVERIVAPSLERESAPAAEKKSLDASPPAPVETKPRDVPAPVPVERVIPPPVEREIAPPPEAKPHLVPIAPAALPEPTPAPRIETEPAPPVAPSPPIAPPLEPVARPEPVTPRAPRELCAARRVTSAAQCSERDRTAPVGTHRAGKSTRCAAPAANGRRTRGIPAAPALRRARSRTKTCSSRGAMP